MPCPECNRLKEARTQAIRVVTEAQTVLDRELETATLREYRQLRVSLSEAKISAMLAEVEAAQHKRECEATWGKLKVRGSSV